jgi:hypothetical protein
MIVENNVINNNNSSKKDNAKYCEELKNTIDFFDSNIKTSLENNLYRSNAKREEVFTNLNIIYLNYFGFQIKKEFNEKC